MNIKKDIDADIAFDMIIIVLLAIVLSMILKIGGFILLNSIDKNSSCNKPANIEMNINNNEKQ